jgi:uncharacterized membrane protein SpoIIM required for sporulation
MKAGAFEEQRRGRWRELEEILDAVEAGRPESRVGEVPRRFREVCADLALAQARICGLPLLERLNALVIRCHHFVYRERRGIAWERVLRFLAAGFPTAVRREWRLFWLCSAAFWLPFVALYFSVGSDLVWAQAVLGADGMAALDGMYGGSESQVEHLRSEYGSNFMMFCFYIQHNVGIDFRIFAGGIAAGVGTLVFLWYNGIYLGAAAGYVQAAGDPQSFWTFVSGHSSWEMVGMVVAGMAGLRLGLGVLNPGRLRRGEALQRAAARALPLVAGAGAMTLVAAVIEGFWSAQPLPAGLKYAAGAVGWVVVGGWILFGGRRAGDAP